MKRAFDSVSVELLGIVPRIDVEGRGMIPEIEIKYEEFGAQAIEVTEQYYKLRCPTKIADAPKLKQIDYGEFMEKFKNLLTNNTLNASEGGKNQNCS